MKHSTKRLYKLLAIILVLYMLILPFGNITVQAAEQSDMQVYSSFNNYDIGLNINSAWGNSFNAEITITNTGNETIENWYLSFKTQNQITGIWNAEVTSYDGERYILKNAGWNSDIRKGETVTIGFIAEDRNFYEASKNSFTDLKSSFKEFLIITEKVIENSENYSIEFNIESSWKEGFTGSLTVTNNTDITIEDWVLSFDFDHEISGIWNGIIEECKIFDEIAGGIHYTVKNAGYNQNIPAGGSVTFGFICNDGAVTKTPENYVLNKYQIYTEGAKYEEIADGVIDEEYLCNAIYPILITSGVDIENVQNIKLSDDFDGDGLDLGTEYKYDTDPFNADTDEDGLNDYEEIYVYNTSPVSEDTDLDGMTDGTEIAAGLDPLNADSDGNGVFDSEEITTQDVRLAVIGTTGVADEAAVPSVTITGTGDYSTKLAIENLSYDTYLSNCRGMVSSPFDFKHDENLNFEKAVLNFDISSKILEKSSLEDLSVVYFNEETGLAEFLDTTYDIGNRRISAEVEHFSIYGVVDRTKYCAAEESGVLRQTDVIIVINTTDKMSKYFDFIKESLDEFAEDSYKRYDTRIKIIEYCGSATGVKEYDWYETKDAFMEKVNSLEPTNKTTENDILSAIELAAEISETQCRETNSKFVYVISDDEPIEVEYENMHDAYIRENNLVHRFGEAGTKYIFWGIYIALMGEHCSTLLICDDGCVERAYNINYYMSEKLIENLIDNKHIIGQYPVCLTNGEMIYLNGNPTDENSYWIDTDGDGLTDIEELGKKVIRWLYDPASNERKFLVQWDNISDPTKTDTDGDGISDYDDFNPKKFDVCIAECSEYFKNIKKGVKGAEFGTADDYIVFNTGHVWKNISYTAYDFIDNLFVQEDGYVNTKIPKEELDKLLQNCIDNRKVDYTFEELCFIGLLNNEGSKLYLNDKPAALRQAIYMSLTGEKIAYYKHSGIFTAEKWEKLESYEESKFWSGKVVSNADINFTTSIYYKYDMYDIFEGIIEAGAVVLSVIIIVEATPVVMANLQALVFYCCTFGISEGMKMYIYLGVSGAPAGVVTWLQMDMSDGDTVLDDAVESGKYSETEIKSIIDNLQGDGFKNNPLRQAYESEVAGLKAYGDELLASGMSEEQVARTLNQARRDLGIKYKNATPQPLRDYIYEVNMGRYGDKLGPTYDWLVNEKGATNMEIINSSSRPNANIDKLLSGFEEWLRRQ